MIAYKWVIKQEGKYYSLINFGVDGDRRKKECFQLPYEIGKSYSTECKVMACLIGKPPRNRLNALTPYTGFHFWKAPTNSELKRWNRTLKDSLKQPTIKHCLICEVKEKDIFIQNDFQLVASGFKVLKGVKL